MRAWSYDAASGAGGPNRLQRGNPSAPLRDLNQMVAPGGRVARYGSEALSIGASVVDDRIRIASVVADQSSGNSAHWLATQRTVRRDESGRALRGILDSVTDRAHLTGGGS
jgi:hypothetical protein